jgi:hypothetical protein
MENKRHRAEQTPPEVSAIPSPEPGEPHLQQELFEDASETDPRDPQSEPNSEESEPETETEDEQQFLEKAAEEGVERADDDQRFQTE